MPERIDPADKGAAEPRGRAVSEAPDSGVGNAHDDDPDVWTGEIPVVPTDATPAPTGATRSSAADAPLIVEGEPDWPSTDPSTGAGAWFERLWTPWIGVLAVFVVAAIVGYAIGWNRGEATVSEASSSTTPVTAIRSGGGSGGAVTTATTAITTTTQPVKAIVAPQVALTTVAFDARLPRVVNGRTVEVPRGAWKATGGTVGPSKVDPIGQDARVPRRYGEGPDLLVDTGAPVSQVDAVLVTPTLYSGVIGRFQDARNYWVVVADKDLANVSLILVKDGVESSKGFVGQKVTPGMAIGMVDVDGQITITINGQPQVLTDFFGSKPSIPDEGIQGTSVGLLAGDGQPRFDNLRFG